MKIIKMITILLLMSFATGCSMLFGVFRSTKLHEPPDTDCIFDSISSVDGIYRVSKQINENKRLFSKTTFPHYNYFYRYGELEGFGRVGIEIGKLAVRFRHNYGEINHKLPQEDIDLIRPVMFEIEERIENRCGIINLQSNIKEKCSRHLKCN